MSVTAGEGVACGVLSGGFNNCEIWILDPGSGDLADNFKELVNEGSEKSYRHKVVTGVFVYTPKNHYGNSKE